MPDQNIQYADLAVQLEHRIGLIQVGPSILFFCITFREKGRCGVSYIVLSISMYGIAYHCCMTRIASALYQVS